MPANQSSLTSNTRYFWLFTYDVRKNENERLLKQLTTLNNEKTQYSNTLHTKSKHLEKQFATARRLGIRRMDRTLKVGLRIAVQRWKKFVADEQEREYDQLCAEAADKIEQLQKEIQAEERENLDIEEQNEELRMICLEGTKTAKVYNDIDFFVI